MSIKPKVDNYLENVDCKEHTTPSKKKYFIFTPEQLSKFIAKISTIHIEEFTKYLK